MGKVALSLQTLGHAYNRNTMAVLHGVLALLRNLNSICGGKVAVYSGKVRAKAPVYIGKVRGIIALYICDLHPSKEK